MKKFMSVIIICMSFQLFACGETTEKNKTDKEQRKQSEVSEICEKKIILYNENCCSDAEMSADFEFVIKNIKDSNLLSERDISIVPYGGDAIFKLVCDDKEKKIDTIMTDIDLIMEAFDFFGMDF